MYLALSMVLWLLVFRGVAIELRGQVAHPLWREGWDGMFVLASTVLAFVAGVALGNVVRGVPIDRTGWFHTDLFALGSERVGALDGYTALVGLLAVVLLATHGASYLGWRTEGALRARCAAAARRGWIVGVVLAAGTTAATALVRPGLFVALAHRPWLWPLPLVAAASPAVALRAVSRGHDLRAFLASSAFVASLLLATAGVLYPLLLPSTYGPAFDLDVRSAASGRHGLLVGLAWWLPAIGLAVLYFINLFRSVRGRVKSGEYGH
jgi:cytochrome d ubiquinol oxidase subunit II